MANGQSNQGSSSSNNPSNTASSTQSSNPTSPNPNPVTSSGPVQVTATQKLPLPPKKDVVDNDALLKGLLNEEGIFDLFDMALAELAEESASLKYERMKKESNDEDTDRISLRRSSILKTIIDSLVQKRNMALNDFVNLRSPQWQVVFDLLMSKMKQTFGDLNFTSEQQELYFQKFQENLEGFEEETEQKLKDSVSNLT